MEGLKFNSQQGMRVGWSAGGNTNPARVRTTLKHYCKDYCKGQKLIVMLVESQGLGKEFAFLGGVDKIRGHDAGESGVPRNGRISQ